MLSGSQDQRIDVLPLPNLNDPTLFDPPSFRGIPFTFSQSIQTLVDPRRKDASRHHIVIPAPRPLSAFRIYTREWESKNADFVAAIRSDQRVFSIAKAASKDWAQEPEEAKRIFDELAARSQRLHRHFFPHYYRLRRGRKVGNKVRFVDATNKYPPVQVFAGLMPWPAFEKRNEPLILTFKLNDYDTSGPNRVSNSMIEFQGISPPSVVKDRMSLDYILN